MKVLVACEESQRVCAAFRKKGFEAYSADIQECSGGHPEWHCKGDVLPILDGDCAFMTESGNIVRIDGAWDLIIAHPPCTYLTVSGNRWFDVEKYGESARQRMRDRYDGIVFFMQMICAKAKYVAVENPVGIMNSCYRKADQIIQPYQFGAPTRKTTCLWLKNLPKLVPTNVVEPELRTFTCKNGKTATFGMGIGEAVDDNGKIVAWNDPMTAKIRSRTFQGIADAMADQWGDWIRKGKEEVQLSLFSTKGVSI